MSPRNRYEEYAGPIHAYSARLPLFYFSKEAMVADVGAINSHSHEAAQNQRDAWNNWQNRYGKKHGIFDEWRR